MKIKPVSIKVTDHNRYCGPAVISAVTGMNTGEAARLIRSISGQKAVKWAFTTHLLRALQLCGIKSFRKVHTPKATLAAWLRESKSIRTTGRVFLVVAGHHFQLIEGRRYVCGRTRDIVSIKDKQVKRRARVEDVYELVAYGKITIPDQARKPKQPANQYRSYIDKMKRKYGFTVEHERWNQTYWVSMPQYAEDLAWDMDHPLRDEHGCYDQSEVANRFEEMAEFMEEYCMEDA
jgi:hypothetical protein